MIASNHVFAAQIVRTVALPWLEFRPDGPPPPAGWPLVLFLHGAGEKGTDGAALHDAVLPRLIAGGLAIDALVVCPQCPPGPGWPIDELSAMLDELIARVDVDVSRIHLTGISMGARGAWELAYRRAADLASITALCGLGIPMLAPLVAALPARLYHGADDDIVPPARSTEMAAALGAAGGDVACHVLNGVDHDCGVAVYGAAATWDWMLAQRRIERTTA